MAIRLALACAYTLVGGVLLLYVYGFASIMSPEDQQQRFWWLIGQRMFLSPGLLVTATGMSFLGMAVRSLLFNEHREEMEPETPRWLLLVVIAVLSIVAVTLCLERLR